MNIGDFIHMGGYALYVWGSYGVATLIIGGLILQAKRRLHRARYNCKPS